MVVLYLNDKIVRYIVCNYAYYKAHQYLFSHYAPTTWHPHTFLSTGYLPPVTESVPSDFTQILNISTIFNIEDCSVSRVIGTLNETTF